MNSKIKIPESIQRICDYLIENAASKTFSNNDLIELQKWLEADGWDDLSAPWRLDTLALNLNEWDIETLSDSSLCDFEGLDESELITDEIRVNFARERIQDEIENGDGLTNPSIIDYKIENADKKSVILGCTVEIHGQLGPEIHWHGVFENKDKFYEYIRNNNYIIQSEVEEMSDSIILGLWKK
jgi:hypothetical protein